MIVLIPGSPSLPSPTLSPIAVFTEASRSAPGARSTQEACCVLTMQFPMSVSEKDGRFGQRRLFKPETLIGIYYSGILPLIRS